MQLILKDPGKAATIHLFPLKNSTGFGLKSKFVDLFVAISNDWVFSTDQNDIDYIVPYVIKSFNSAGVYIPMEWVRAGLDALPNVPRLTWEISGRTIEVGVTK